MSQAGNQIATGSNDLTQQFGAALQPFLANSATAGAGVNQLGNLLGLNGASGNQQATSTLQSTPGYQFALNQGAQNVNRNAAAGGQLASGNTLQALQTQGQGQAQQTTNSLISALQPYLGLAQTSAAGQAGVDTGLGTALNSNQNSLANLDYTGATGVGNAQANGILGSAQEQASGLQSLLSLAGSGASAGGSAGAGGGLSSLMSGAGNLASGVGSGIGSLLAFL